MSKKDKNTDSHYVDNKKFLEAIKKYQNECKGLEGDDIPPIPDYIGECILLIAEGLSNRPNFINYAYKGDMIGEAIHDCVKAVHKFDPDFGSNPFSYFTQITWYAFLRTIKKEKKQEMTKYALIKNANGEGDYTKWLKDNGHLDPHATEEDLKMYHYLTDDDLKEIENASKPKKKKERKKPKKKSDKKPLIDGDDEE